jgi:5-methylcytosine-specific restriction endonuclease McrA
MPRASVADTWNNFRVRRSKQLLRTVAESDHSFRLRDVRGMRAWVGPCLHCKRSIMVPVDARFPASATLEHIVPRTHGGTDELDNLGLACAACNHEKGRKLDSRPLADPTLQRVIERLRTARRTRMS